MKIQNKTVILSKKDVKKLEKLIAGFLEYKLVVKELMFVTKKQEEKPFEIKIKASDKYKTLEIE